MKELEICQKCKGCQDCKATKNLEWSYKEIKELKERNKNLIKALINISESYCKCLQDDDIKDFIKSITLKEEIEDAR
jgi:hypothetical protein